MAQAVQGRPRGSYANQAAVYERIRHEMVTINTVLDAEAMSYATNCGLTTPPPRLSAFNLTNAVGRFGDMIRFTRDPVQALLNWRNCSPHKQRLEALDLSAPRAMFDRLAQELEHQPGSGIDDDDAPWAVNHHEQDTTSPSCSRTGLSFERVPQPVTALPPMNESLVAPSPTTLGLLSPFYPNTISIDNPNTSIEQPIVNMDSSTPQYPMRTRSPYAGTGSYINPSDYPSIATPTGPGTYVWNTSRNVDMLGSHGTLSQRAATPPARPGSAQEALGRRSRTSHLNAFGGHMPQLLPKQAHARSHSHDSILSGIDPALLSPPVEQPPTIHSSQVQAALHPTPQDTQTSQAHDIFASAVDRSLGHQDVLHKQIPAQTPPGQPNTVRPVSQLRYPDVHGKSENTAPIEQQAQVNPRHQSVTPAQQTAPSGTAQHTVHSQPPQSHRLTPAPTPPPNTGDLVDVEEFYRNQQLEVAKHHKKVRAQAKAAEEQQRKWEEWHRMKAEELEREKQNEKRKARNRFELKEDIRKGNEVLAYRYHDYMEAFPPSKEQGADRSSLYYRNLLANDKDQPDDGSEGAMAVLYAKHRWWNYWEKKDKVMVTELMRQDRGGGWRE